MSFDPPALMSNMMTVAPGQLASSTVNAAPVVVDDTRLNKVYVSPLGPGVDEGMLRFFFEGCGQILRVTVHKSKGDHQYGFIEFANQAGAKKAIGKSGIMMGEYSVRVQQCQEQKESTDLFGLRPTDKTEAELKEEWNATHELARTAAAYERWQENEREQKAKAIQDKAIRKIKRKAKRRHRDTSSGSDFDSAASTPQKKRRARRGSSSSSASSSLPSPPTVFYQGP